MTVWVGTSGWSYDPWEPELVTRVAAGAQRRFPRSHCVVTSNG